MTLIERLRERLSLKYIGFCDCPCQLVPAADVAEAADRIEALEAALREIVETGTREITNRVGDAWSDDGWTTDTVVSAEAEIAARALQGEKQQ